MVAVMARAAVVSRRIGPHSQALCRPVPRAHCKKGHRQRQTDGDLATPQGRLKTSRARGFFAHSPGSKAPAPYLWEVAPAYLAPAQQNVADAGCGPGAAAWARVFGARSLCSAIGLIDHHSEPSG